MSIVKETNRYHSAVQWIQALFIFGILLIIYTAHNATGKEKMSAFNLQASTPSVAKIPQKSYWNEELGYGFSANKNDSYHREVAKKIPVEVDRVALNWQEGTIFEDAKVRVSFYPTLSIDEIEKRHPAIRPRSYSRLSR